MAAARQFFPTASIASVRKSAPLHATLRRA